MKINWNLPDVKRLSRIILETGLPIIVITLIYIAFHTYIKSSDPVSTLKIVKQTSIMLEHALMSLTLILGGALLANTISDR